MAGYWAELGRLVLKRLLLLALLLDVAAEHPARPAGTPLLFRRGQPLKSSAAAVAQLLAGRLRGEAAMALSQHRERGFSSCATVTCRRGLICMQCGFVLNMWQHDFAFETKFLPVSSMHVCAE